MKKICYITTLGTTIDSFFIPQINYLATNGFDVTVICSPDTPNLKDKFGDDVHYITLNIPRGISFLGMLKAIKGFKRIFREEQFELIQYSTPNAALCAAYAGIRCGIKLRNYHLMGFRYLGASGFLRKVLKSIEKWTCSLSTSIECVSKSNLVMGIAEKIFPEDKATVVWNGSSGGVDCTRFDYNKREQWRKEIRAELGYTEDDFVYGFVGRITRDKGINELIEAYFSLETDAKLFLVGNIEDEQTLDTTLLNQARNDLRVQFHPAVMDIERYYAAIDVLLLPSYREGFGNVVIEAGAVGTPAIVSNIPGPIDTIDEGRTALTVEVKNITDLAEKLKEIREADYRSMGQNAAIFAKEKFNSEMLCEKILERKNYLLGRTDNEEGCCR